MYSIFLCFHQKLSYVYLFTVSLFTRLEYKPLKGTDFVLFSLVLCIVHGPVNMLNKMLLTS